MYKKSGVGTWEIHKYSNFDRFLIWVFPFLIDLSSLKSGIVSFRRGYIPLAAPTSASHLLLPIPVQSLRPQLHPPATLSVRLYLPHFRFILFDPILSMLIGKYTDLGINYLYFLMRSGRFIALFSIKLQSQKKLENVWNHFM